MSASGSIILAMALSGGLAGLGGSMEVLGTVPQMSNDISSGFGFNAIALALLAGNRPARHRARPRCCSGRCGPAAA